MTADQIAAAHAETERLTHELDITNADHIALWLEANMADSSLAWLACRIVEAHEAAISEPASVAGEAGILPCDVRLPPATLIRAGCSFDTLRLAMSNPDRPKHFRETGAEKQARQVMMPQSGSVSAPSGGQSYGMLSGCMDFTEPSPPSPQPDMGSGEAIGLIGEASFAEVVDCDFWSLQLHFGKGDAARDKMRAVSDALRSAAALSPPASQSVEKMTEALEAACNLKWCKEDRLDQAIKLLREALSALPHKEEATPAPVGGQGWQPIKTCELWQVAIVTDGEHVAIAQKAKADYGGHYWAVDPEDALEWEPTHWIAEPATPATTTTERGRG